MSDAGLWRKLGLAENDWSRLERRLAGTTSTVQQYHWDILAVLSSGMDNSDNGNQLFESLLENLPSLLLVLSQALWTPRQAQMIHSFIHHCCVRNMLLTDECVFALGNLVSNAFADDILGDSEPEMHKWFAIWDRYADTLPGYAIFQGLLDVLITGSPCASSLAENLHRLLRKASWERLFLYAWSIHEFSTRYEVVSLGGDMAVHHFQKLAGGKGLPATLLAWVRAFRLVPLWYEIAWSEPPLIKTDIVSYNARRQWAAALSTAFIAAERPPVAITLPDDLLGEHEKD